MKSVGVDRYGHVVPGDLGRSLDGPLGCVSEEKGRLIIVNERMVGGVTGEGFDV